MSNQQKSEFVNGNFGIQSFWEGHGEIVKILIYTKRSSLPRILIQQTGRVPDSRNS
jgi:hypothetical protein